MTEIFGRFDFDVIASLDQEGERVLDLGCGDGSLLKFLQVERYPRLRRRERSRQCARCDQEWRQRPAVRP